MNYKLRPCPDCGNKFSPTGGNQKRCRPCADARAQTINREAQRRWKQKKGMTPKSEIQPLRDAVCEECGAAFRTRRERARVCPACLPHDKPEAEDKTITEPGPCRSCRSHEIDGRGILRCPLMGGIECAAANPSLDCGMRVPEIAPAAAVESVTDTLVRRAGVLMERSRVEAEDMARLSHRKIKGERNADTTGE